MIHFIPYGTNLWPWVTSLASSETVRLALAVCYNFVGCRQSRPRCQGLKDDTRTQVQYQELFEADQGILWLKYRRLDARGANMPRWRQR